MHVRGAVGERDRDTGHATTHHTRERVHGERVGARRAAVDRLLGQRVGDRADGLRYGRYRHDRRVPEHDAGRPAVVELIAWCARAGKPTSKPDLRRRVGEQAELCVVVGGRDVQEVFRLLKRDERRHEATSVLLVEVRELVEQDLAALEHRILVADDGALLDEVLDAVLGRVVERLVCLLHDVLLWGVEGGLWGGAGAAWTPAPGVHCTTSVRNAPGTSASAPTRQ